MSGEEEITVSAVSVDKPTVKVTGRLTDSIQSYVDKFVAAYNMQDDVKAGKVEIKLLYQGKILKPTATAQDSNFIDGCVVHYVVKLVSRPERSRREVRINMTGGGSNSNGGRRARGLARLADVGFSPEEIEELRTMYRAERMLRHSELPVSDENDLEGEERWLNQMLARTGARNPFLRGGGGGGGGGDDDEEDENGSGQGFMQRANVPRLSTGGEFFLGLSLGFGLGFITICCLFLRNLSLSTKLGITTGICLNILLSSYAAKASRKS